MSIFFTADEHHGHRNIIKFCARPFPDIETMTEELVKRHNEVVRPGDIVHHLGDMFWRTFGLKRALEVMDRLNGQHFYTLGNHCELFEFPELRQKFIWVRERTRIRNVPAPKLGIVLDHYAGRVWDKSHDGSWQLYGHTHAVLEEEPFLLSCDVGVDAWNYYPVAYEQIAEKMKAKMPAYLERKEAFEKIAHKEKL